MVDEIVAQGVAVLQEIVADETLTAIPKRQEAVQASGSWKLERKEEMIEVGRLLIMEENVLLRHEFHTETVKR